MVEAVMEVAMKGGARVEAAGMEVEARVAEAEVEAAAAVGRRVVVASEGQEVALQASN